MIDDREERFPKHDVGLINKLCTRRFGIGADGLILLQNDPETNFRMVYFNADGRESTMCGNGGRCIVAFAKQLGVIKSEASFMAIDGLHEAIVEDETVSLGMIDVSTVESALSLPFVNTGSPHLVKEVNNVEELNVAVEGKTLREKHSQEGANVNFVTKAGDTLKVRTYERGVEAETYSCGTGVTAVALAMNKDLAHGKYHVPIQTLGGDLAVKFESTPNGFKNIQLVGPATFVYQGSFSC